MPAARKKRAGKMPALFRLVARPERFELPTPKFVAWCSIQLSYGRKKQKRNCAEPGRLRQSWNDGKLAETEGDAASDQRPQFCKPLMPLADLAKVTK